MKDKLVYIEWDDASSEGGWKDRDGITTIPYRCRSAGFVVAETGKSIKLATNVSCNGMVSETMQIPKTQIRKRKTVATYDALKYGDK